MPLSPPDAFEYARKAVETWTGLGSGTAEVAVIVKAFEKAAPGLAQVIHTGHGYVEIKVRDKQLMGVFWYQGTFSTQPY